MLLLFFGCPEIILLLFLVAWKLYCRCFWLPGNYIAAVFSCLEIILPLFLVAWKLYCCCFCLPGNDIAAVFGCLESKLVMQSTLHDPTFVFLICFRNFLKRSGAAETWKKTKIHM